MKELTEKQKQVLFFIWNQIELMGYPPTVREITDEIGLRSTSSTHFHLKNLEDNGYIMNSNGKCRAISILHFPEELLPSGGSEIQYVEETSPRNKYQVPLLGNVAAGTPILAEECVEEYIYFNTGGRPEEYFALRVRGDSMLDAGIFSGDLVVVHLQEQVKSGKIVVALLNQEEATVKTLNISGEGVWLLPENKNYEPIDGKFAEILGQVVSVIRVYD